MSGHIRTEQRSIQDLQELLHITDAEAVMLTALGSTLLQASVESSRFRKTMLGLYVSASATESNNAPLELALISSGVHFEGVKNNFAHTYSLRRTFISNTELTSTFGRRSTVVDIEHQQLLLASSLQTVRRMRLTSASMPPTEVFDTLLTGAMKCSPHNLV